MSDIQDKIKELRERFVDGGQVGDELDVINEWELELKRAMLTDQLKNHPAIKMILEQVSTFITDVDFLLSNDEKLNADTPEARNQRQILFLKKKMWQWFIDLFTVAEATIEQVGAKVSENLQE